ncbi:DUF4368 domain-containing protein [Anaerococcus porci]|uniref:DUF4368 domain-containing protein n=1 Tax=Anaerococcus porci TaxID=2652269 RepID=A0A6N7VTR2_9FIRM|nr:DUF4368 domain-containing protein [Anaerococcus porci]MDY3005663.1 DUF4368 domain-containing protein [Anaerococcus porci]MSS77444.1 DUF4368 domain-containing protein [Anaerococcus porci]
MIPKICKEVHDIKELNPEIIRTFVDEIHVEQSEKVQGTNLKRQQFGFIGTSSVKSTYKNRHKG